jgi:molecular chaperone GrpE
LTEADRMPPEEPRPEPEPEPGQDAAAGDAERVEDAAAPADAPGEPTADDDVAEAEAAIVDDINSLERERDEYLDALRRLQADFENFKKRMVRQQTELLERAGETLVEKLLPVLDAVDLARQHGANDGALEPIANALVDALSKEGLERIDPVGQPFDPNEHEAVAHEPLGDSDAGEHDGKQLVAGLMRAGYRWKGKLLRPAMVSVKG